MAETDRDILVEIRTDLRYIRETVVDHESRIRMIEMRQNRWVGRDGAIVAGIAALVSLITVWFTWALSTFGGAR